jgi:hypothetical protein
MSPEQFQQLQNTVSESIEKNVNGKIRALDFKMETYIREDNEYKARMEEEKERMAEETRIWREKADENLEAVANVRSFGKVGMYFIGVIASIGGAVLLIINLIKR